MLQVCGGSASQNMWSGMEWQVTDITDPSVFIISLKEVLSQHTIRSIYFPDVHSHLICGVAFWGGSAGINTSHLCGVLVHRGFHKLVKKILAVLASGL
jgi:hypothetical protein